MAIRRTHRPGSAMDLAPAVQLWILRILMSLGGHREFVTTRGFSNDSVAEALVWCLKNR